MKEFDVIIIGGGPGGTQAARRLCSAGKKVALVEDSHYGGTCLNCGCIPTKMLLGATAPKAQMAALERLRFVKGQMEVDYVALQTRVWRFVNGTSQTLAKSLTAMGIELLRGKGVCVDTHTVLVQGEEGEEECKAGHIVLACGSRSAAFPGLTPDGDCVLDSTAMLHLPEVPQSLIIVGGGAIGLEMADFFAAMGSAVTLVEAAPHILPTEDGDIAKEMQRALTKSGKKVLEGVKAKALQSVAGKAVLELEDGTKIEAHKALVAVGRTPNTAGLGAEHAGFALTKRGFVLVNDSLQAAPHIYAVGDVNGITLLAHAAEHQGDYVARRILGEEQGAYVSGPVPSCVYGSMEVMRVGRTATELAREGKVVTVSSAPLSANAIAQAGGHTTGFVKAVWCEGSLMGMAAVGHHVSQLVTAAQLLVLKQLTGHGEFMFAHPTLDEALAAALAAAQKPYTPAP